MARRRGIRKSAVQVSTLTGRSDVYLCEAAWEVCNQVGGIYTVVRSKSPYLVEHWGDRYCLVGPFYPDKSFVEFEEHTIAEPFQSAVEALRAAGIEAVGGRWLVTGKPQVVLIRPESVMRTVADIKYFIWKNHHVDMYVTEPLVDEVVCFGHILRQFFGYLSERLGKDERMIGHFHEWMAATSLADIRRDLHNIATVFTTHATLLGRYLATGDASYQHRMTTVDWHAEAVRCQIVPQASLERIAAHSAHIFSTVSEVTSRECEYLLGRRPEVLLPNGLNIERFVALHEFQNLHRVYKDKINQFVIGHFFPSYTFDLDKTLYYFTSGRYEHGNKGFNLTIDALARLNDRLKREGVDSTIVFFLITNAAKRSVNAEVLRQRALMEEINRDCEAIKEQVGSRLFGAVAQGHWPRFDDLVDEYWRLRLRRDLQAWHTKQLPAVVTHDLMDEEHDPILAQLRECNLMNRPEDRVKIVFNPAFVSSADLLFRMDYDQFVRGSHLGVFPSLYEPWGYTPLECVALGIPTITSDMAGFGTFVLNAMPDHYESGIMVVRRRNVSFEDAAEQMTEFMYQIAMLDRRERIALRNNVEATSELFDWHNLGLHYDEAHEMALARL
jgi:glycogen synthase